MCETDDGLPTTVSTVPSPHTMVQLVIVSSPGSVAPRDSVYVWFSIADDPPVTDSVGPVFVTVSVVVAVSVSAPSLTRSPIVYVPSSVMPNDCSVAHEIVGPDVVPSPTSP